MQVGFRHPDQGQAVISIQGDNGIGTGIIGGSQQIGQIGKAEIRHVELIVGPGSGPAIEPVISRAAKQDVVTSTAIQPVITRTAGEEIIA